MRALILATAICAVLAAGTCQAQGVPTYNLNQLCAERWPGDHGMQRACIRNEMRERHWLRYAKYPDDVWRKCLARETRDSYSSLALCVRAGGPIEFSRQRPAAPRAAIEPGAEERKARARAETGYRDPGAQNLCPRPLRMTERDGCQPPKR